MPSLYHLSISPVSTIQRLLTSGQSLDGVKCTVPLSLPESAKSETSITRPRSSKRCALTPCGLFLLICSCFCCTAGGVAADLLPAASAADMAAACCDCGTLDAVCNANES
ncbi:hypothetical protein PRIPAC_85981, partial [Pristionchus pacificus]|uniref:Uncharacterized protein n=1 Tax=Pristionchus pacificus TaxID=54126 RepID=A0A2A6BSL7_PRIPA